MRRMIKIINPPFKKSSTSRAFARKKGRNNVTVDDLVQVITPKGRDTLWGSEFRSSMVFFIRELFIYFLVAVMPEIWIDCNVIFLLYF
ncbi:hypothetical protein I3760_05G230300 [Carya illinoinensis]|nr:hypothetical protein I3760_11G196500 [Carya illinoinensis]KAG2709265.1 hypothetical protein I3760_05G230300 [Carya illinoinensis]